MSEPTQLFAVSGWCLYLLECRGGTIYTGVTNRLPQRIRQHCLGKGARYTRANPPRRLLAARPYPDRASAQRAEWAVKRMSAEQKRRLADRLNTEANAEPALLPPSR
jgi:putative endonuclease